MQVFHTEITVPGLRAPVRMMQITDMHLTEAESESAYVMEHAAARTAVFDEGGKTPTAEQYRACFRLARENGADIVMLTGDIIDFPSAANLALMHSVAEESGIPYLYTYGNHDWNYPREGEGENSAVKAANSALFAPMFGGENPAYGMMRVGGMRFIVLDNAQSTFTDAQYSFLKEQFAAGEPCVVGFHVPLYADTLWEDTVRVWRVPILVDLPHEVRAPWPFLGPADEETKRVVDLLESPDSPVAALIAGHVHFDHDDAVAPGRMQYIATACVKDAVRMYTFVPET